MLKSGLVLALLVADLVSGASYTYVSLGVQGADANSTSPNGINDSRTVVGTYSVTQQCVHTYCATPYGFIWKDGTFTTISFPGGNGTAATAINNSGQIVGNYTTVPQTPQKSNGFIYNGGTFTTLNVSGAVLTQPKGINSSGQVVGYFQSPSNQSPSDHGFLRSGTTFTTYDYPGQHIHASKALTIPGQSPGLRELVVPMRVSCIRQVCSRG